MSDHVIKSGANVKQITSAACAKFLDLDLIGDDIDVSFVADLFSEVSCAVKFVTSYNQDWVTYLNSNSKNFLIVIDEYDGMLTVPHVISKNPRLDFCKLSKQFFPNEIRSGVEKSAVIGKNVSLGNNVYVGHNTVIEDDVVVGNATVILHNVVVASRTKIGSFCLIKSGTVIGQKGFGFERDALGFPVDFTHYGRVKIGDHVEIGALNTLVAGALSDTVIGDHVKTDDHVHIAHNVVIGRGTLITACSEISGSVKIGEQCWLGPNTSIIDKVVLGNKVFVGIGSVVTKSFPDSARIIGVPAKMLKTIET